MISDTAGDESISTVDGVIPDPVAVIDCTLIWNFVAKGATSLILIMISGEIFRTPSAEID